MSLRAKAWLEQGVAMLRLDDIADDFLRQGIINACNRLYGGPGK